MRRTHLWAALSSLALAMLPCSLATAQSATFRYRVQEGDTCAGIARRLYGSAEDYERIHELNPALGPPPHRLEAGTVLVLPRPPDDGPDARVTGADNVVRSRAPGGQFTPASVGDALSRGHRVETGARSSAELTFRDRSTVQLREETLVIVYGGTRSLAERRSTATLERGALRSRLAELTGRLSVDTPGGTARVVGGDAIVAVSEDGSSRLANHEGRPATVTAANVSVRVPAGTGTLVRRGAPPSPPRPLPAPPSWRVDQPGRFVGLTGRGGTIRGAFEAAPSAVAYRVEIARRPDGTDVAAAIEISAPTTEFALHRLPAGVYYVAVATIDEWLLEGLPSPRRAVQVLEARVIPPGGGEPVVEPYDPGDPSRPDRLPRVLPGTWIVAPVGFSCGPSGTQPSEMSTLLGAGRTAVRCFDPGGREVPAFDVVLEAPRALVEREPTLVRRRVESRVRLRLESDLELPSRLVAWSVPGVHIGHVTRQPDGAFEVPITVSTDGPSSFAVTVGVAEADERVALSHFAVEVEGAPVSPPSVLEEPAPDRRRFDTALAAFSHLPLPNVVGLLPTGGRGARFHVAFAAITPPRDGAADSLRTNVGARARLFDQPFEIGFDWTIDGSGDYASSARRGQADIRVFTNLTYPASDDFALTTDVTAWIPTHAAEGSLDDVRLVPSVTLEGTFARPLFFRTRQALVVDTGERALAWSSAYGVDARLPSSPLTLGAEIQVVVGDVDGRGAAAVGLAATAGVKLGPTETIVGVRGGLGPDAQALMGELTGLVAVRVLIPSL